MSNYKYYVGAKFNTEIGGDFEIIEIIDNNNVKIRFSDEFQFEKVISKDSISRGFAKNPFKPTVFGVGYLGVGKYKSICKTSSEKPKSSIEYNAW